MNSLRPVLALTVWLSLCLGPTSAGADAPKSAVSFSPKVIDFGQIPSSEHPTQLLTIKFDRRVFPSDHLPSLRADATSDLKLTLFSRVDDPKTITIIDRVTFLGYNIRSRFHLNLTLYRNSIVSNEELPTVAVEDNGVTVKGEVVQGLDTNVPALDFGHVAPGKGATKEFDVGVFGPNLVSRGEFTRRSKARKPGLEEMSVTSSSPYVTAVSHREMGLNGSSWVTWQIVLSPKTPANFGPAELVFHTVNGYSLTVPVYADIRSLPVSEPQSAAKH